MICRISAYSGNLFKYENADFNGEQEKESIIQVRIGLEKLIPRDHCLSSLGKPGNANQ